MNKNLDNILIKITDRDFNPDLIPSINISDYKIRKASRGILRKNNMIALINMVKNNYHKLPGGGAKKRENYKETFIREILEETGCRCEVEDEGPVVVEYRGQTKTHQISKVFFATVVGKPEKVKFEEDEIENGATLEWISVNKIRDIFANDNPKDYEGQFIHKRDLAIIDYYRERLNK